MKRDVLAAGVTYPPVLPLTLAGLLILLEPLTGVVVVALVAKAALVVVTYTCARPMGRLYGAFAAVLVGLAGAQLEAYSWGAYPQLLGTAFGITAVSFAVRYALSGDKRHLWLAGLLTALTYLTHTLIGGLLVCAIPVAVFHGLYMTRPAANWRRGVWTVAFLILPGALLFAYQMLTNPREGIQPVLNPLSLDWMESVAQTVSEAPIPWWLVACVGLGAVFMRGWDVGRTITLATAGSWIVAGLLFFAVIGEPRALLLAQLGFVFLALLSFQRFLGWLRSARLDRGWNRAAPAAAKLVIILGIATVSAIAVGSIDRYDNTTEWYRVVDRAEIQALDVLASEAAPGDLVVASRGNHGNQIGWWVQGYAGVRAYTGVDVRYLTFHEEREEARIANEFFEESSQFADSIKTLQMIGADFVVVDKRGVDAPWLGTPAAAEFEMIHESRNLVVLRVPTT
jgi:hypothetical protein